MFNFFDKLPDKITVSGEDFPINTDFKTWAQFDYLMTESDLSSYEKIVSVFTICFPQKRLPKDFQETILKLLDFYSCFKKGNDAEYVNGTEKKRVLSFYQDAPYIYSAVLSQYGVDLFKENPHWFLFSAMVDGLGEKHKISKIIEARSVNLSEIKDRKQREYMRKMKKRYALYSTKTGMMTDSEMADVLSKMFN